MVPGHRFLLPCCNTFPAHWAAHPGKEVAVSFWLLNVLVCKQLSTFHTHFLGSYTSQPSKGAENHEFLVPGWAGSARQPWGSLEGSVLEGVTPDSHPGGWFWGMVHCLPQGEPWGLFVRFSMPSTVRFFCASVWWMMSAWLPRTAEEECNFRHWFPCCLSNNSLSPSWKVHYSCDPLSQVQEHRDVFMEHCLCKGNSSKLLIQNIH